MTPSAVQAFCYSLRSLPRTPNAKSYDRCTRHRILGDDHWFPFIVGHIERVEIAPMLKKQATSTEGPEQEDPDAAGVTSVEEIDVMIPWRPSSA
jgi:hypothetical protein